MRFCLAVVALAVLMFSLISGKQAKYLLPLLPLIGLLCARWLVAADHETQRYRLHHAGFVLIGTGFVLLVLPRLALMPDWFPVPWVAAVALLATGGLCFALKLKLTAAVRGAALAMLLGTATVYLTVVPPLVPRYDLDQLIRVLFELQHAQRKLAWLGRYHGQFHFLGRLRLPIEPITEPGQLRDWLTAHVDGFLLVNYKSLQPDLPDGLLTQPYRGGSLVLWPASRLLEDKQRLDALYGNA